MRRARHVSGEVTGTLLQRAGLWLANVAREARLHAKATLFDCTRAEPPCAPCYDRNKLYGCGHSVNLRNLYKHLDADAGHSQGPEGSGVSTDPARNPRIGVTDPVPGDLPC